MNPNSFLPNGPSISGSGDPDRGVLNRISHPQPGETKFAFMPSREVASRIVESKYTVVDLKPCNDASGSYWAVESYGGFCAMIGYLPPDKGGELAILHKSGGARTLEIIDAPHSPAEAPPAPSSTPTPPPAPGAAPEPAGAQGGAAYVLRQKLADCESAFATAERQRDEALALVDGLTRQSKQYREALERSCERWEDLAHIIREKGSYDNAGFCEATAGRYRKALAPQSNESAARVSEPSTSTL